MVDREQQLLDAALQYEALLAGAEPVSIQVFVATADPALRDELAEYLELYLITEQPHEPIIPTAEEQALIDRVAERTQIRLQQVMATTAPAQSLTALRTAQKLSPARLAQRINLPIDLWHRIERGGVVAATIPQKLVKRLAAALQQAEDVVQAALAGPPVAGATRLSARDGTTLKTEEAVDFAEALAASTATDAQKAEWK